MRNAPSIPTRYQHRNCGTLTEMSDRIAHNMSLDPCYYLKTAVCAKCGEVPESECILKSGERLSEYHERILRSKGPAYHLVRRGMWIILALVGAALGFRWGMSAKEVGMSSGGMFSALVGATMGSIAGLLWGHIPRLLLCKLKLI